MLHVAQQRVILLLHQENLKYECLLSAHLLNTQEE